MHVAGREERNPDNTFARRLHPSSAYGRVQTRFRGFARELGLALELRTKDKAVSLVIIVGRKSSAVAYSVNELAILRTMRMILATRNSLSVDQLHLLNY